ncbi:MAG: glycosyltransferase [Gammaproteobacteria bacterium]
MQWIYLILFFISLALITYNLLIYPVIIVVLSKIKHRSVIQFTDEEQLPTLTLIVSAFQAADTLEKKIHNCLRLFYPKGKLQIIFVSDKHDEQVQEILSRYRKQGIANLRKIKLNDNDQAFHLGGKLAQGAIIVFSHAHTDFNDMALVTLAKNLKGKNVGAVSGKHTVYESRNSHTSLSNNLYFKYESLIKSAESNLGSITSADSEILAVKKSLFSGITDKQLNYDDAIVYKLARSGHRVIYEPNANAFSDTPDDIKDDFRTLSNKAKGFYRLIFSEWSNMFPPKTLFKFMFFSHRVLPLFMPFMLAILLGTSIALYQQPLVQIALYIQIGIYSLTFVNWFLRNNPIFRRYTSIIMYFVMMNIALFSGYLKYLLSAIKNLFSRKKQIKQST